MRLIDYHEEIAAGRERARRYILRGERGKARVVTGRMDAYEERIASKVASQRLGAWEGENPGLRYGAPDAVREYPRRAR